MRRRFYHLWAYLLACFYEKHFKFHNSHLFSLRRFRTVETMPICKSRYDRADMRFRNSLAAGNPNQGLCNVLQHRNLLSTLWIKNKFSCNQLIFTGKHLCHSLFLNKVAGLMPPTLLKKWLWHRCFFLYSAKFLGTPF